MPFRARNPYYLRISQRSVLPLYVFLDERHIDWMTDRVLQYVLADLRPLILPKLKAEADAHLGPGGPANAKKGTVDVHKGEFYQFCFFFRKTEPHSVLIKSRTFVTASQSRLMPPPPLPSSSRPGKGKGKRKGPTLKQGTKESLRKKRKTKGKGRAGMDLDGDESAVSSGDDNAEETNSKGYVDASAPRRSRRTNKRTASHTQQEAEANEDFAADSDAEMVMPHDEPPETATVDAQHAPGLRDECPIEGDGQSNAIPVEGGDPTIAVDVDTVMHNTGSATSAIDLDLEIEDEEQKPKPMLQLRYQGFGIYGHCLCVVVEPFPPIRSSSRAPSVALLREASLRPPNLGITSIREQLREGTPLFLPDYDRRSETPAPIPQENSNSLFHHPIFDEAGVTDDDDSGMMEFSQVLNAAGDFRIGGAMDNDDEMDGAVFFGDADEGREL